MVRPSRRGKFRPLTDAESTTGTVDGDDIEWPSGSLTDEPSDRDQWKEPVAAATTADITIATALNAGDTIDGVTLAAGDRVLVKNQTLAFANGIYIVGTTPARSADFDDPEEVPGAVVYVIDGTTNGGTAWRTENTTEPVMDADDITFASFGAGGSFSGDATDVPIVDSGGHFTGTDVETALEELATEKVAIVFVIDGGGATISTGIKGDLRIPFACILTGWTLLADQSGAIVIDVWRDTLANYPPTDADALPGSGKEPTISASGTNAEDTSITDWTSDDIAAGDCLRFNVDSVSSIQRVTLTLYATRV